MAETLKELHTLYGGKVKIWFYPNSHQYKIDGTKTNISSASAIAKLIDDFDGTAWATGRIGDYVRQYLEKSKSDTFTRSEVEMFMTNALADPENYTKETQDNGKAVHDLCERFAKDIMEGRKFDLETLPNNPKILNSFNAFVDWYSKNDIEFIHTERLVYSMKSDLVGRTDLVAKVNGVKSIVDFKTGALYPKSFVQTGVYIESYNEEMTYLKKKKECVEQGIIINFNRDTGLATPVFLDKDLQAEISEFLKAGSDILKKKKVFQKLIREAYKNNE